MGNYSTRLIRPRNISRDKRLREGRDAQRAVKFYAPFGAVGAPRHRHPSDPPTLRPSDPPSSATVDRIAGHCWSLLVGQRSGFRGRSRDSSFFPRRAATAGSGVCECTTAITLFLDFQPTVRFVIDRSTRLDFAPAKNAQRALLDGTGSRGSRVPRTTVF